jgi:integrase
MHSVAVFASRNASINAKLRIILHGLIEELKEWRAETPYPLDSDYVFASTKKNGKQPYWMSKIMQVYIKPVAERFGIPLKGYHTLRHSYTTLLRQNGNNPKVVQALLRHASYQITANIYDEAVSAEKRQAHSEVIRLVRPVPHPVPGFAMVES